MDEAGHMLDLMLWRVQCKDAQSKRLAIMLCLILPLSAVMAVTYCLCDVLDTYIDQ